MTDVNTSRQMALLKFLRGGLEELGGREMRKNDARFTIYIRMVQCLCEYMPEHVMQGFTHVPGNKANIFGSDLPIQKGT
jgi:hypothetical protein